MKCNELKINKKIYMLFILMCLVTVIVFLLGFKIKNENFLDSISKESNQSESDIKEIDITKVLNNIKSINGVVEYESNNIPEFTSLVFLENERYKNILVDTETGEQLEFKDFIKEESMEEFDNKEYELLSLKYPEFILEGIHNSDGYKIYYVKDNEVIIFYYDYTFQYEYNDIISLRIDYNEIKDLVNFTPNLNESYENENGFVYIKDKKTVALTLDDGPSRIYNSKILDVLNRNKAHATFYMVGQMMYSCQKCVLDTYNSGNEIGSHTYEHINIKNSSVNSVLSSLKKTNDLYYKVTGDNIKTIRPPYGAYDRENLESINIPLILWNLDTQDWRYRDPDYIVNHIKDNIKDGSIILMHELYETSYQALEIILPWLYANDYQVVSVSELANLKNVELKKGNSYSYFK